MIKHLQNWIETWSQCIESPFNRKEILRTAQETHTGAQSRADRSPASGRPPERPDILSHIQARIFEAISDPDSGHEEEFVLVGQLFFDCKLRKSFFGS
jgi:hypothetical protein